MRMIKNFGDSKSTMILKSHFEKFINKYPKLKNL